MSVLIQLCSRYLARIIFIPCILLGMVVITNGVVATRDMGESVQDQHNVELASVLFDVVHELQKERGRTAGFIGSKGQQQRNELQSQRALVDKQVARFTSSLPAFQLGEQQRALVNEVVTELRQLTAIRSRIDALTIPLGDALGYFTHINETALDSILVSARNTQASWISKTLTALFNLSNVKEYSGVERAVLAGVSLRRGSHIACPA